MPGEAEGRLRAGLNQSMRRLLWLWSFLTERKSGGMQVVFEAAVRREILGFEAAKMPWAVECRSDYCRQRVPVWGQHLQLGVFVRVRQALGWRQPGDGWGRS